MSSLHEAEQRLEDQRDELNAYLKVRGQAVPLAQTTEKERMEEYVELVFKELPNHYDYLEKDPSRQDMYSYLQSILTKVGVPHQSGLRELVVRNVLNDMYNYPTAWQKVMDDDNIYEIKVYASNEQFEGQATIRRMFVKGVIDRSELIMSETQLERFLKRKWVGTGFLFDPSRPSSEGIFPDGSRVHVRHGSVGYTVIDAQGHRLVKNTMVITVRKFPMPIDLDMSVELEHITQEDKAYLVMCGQLVEGVLFAGPTGSGKSTLMGAWLGTLPANEEICVMEDGLTDLQPLHPRAGRLWTRNANSEGRGEISLEDNDKEILRMNFDHYCLGETKTPKAASGLTTLALSCKGVVTTTLHVRSEGDGRRAVWRFLNLLGRVDNGIDYRLAADIFADSFKHLVITDDTPKGLRVRYIYEIGAFDWDTMSLPLYLVSSWEEETDTFHFHGATERFANRAKRRGMAMTLPMGGCPPVEKIRFS